MYKCSICSKEFAIEFIYNSHFTKCKEKAVCDDDDDGEVKTSSSSSSSSILIDSSVLSNLINKQNELEYRISKLEKHNRVSDLSLPLNDYMNWIKSLNITLDDKTKSFYGVINAIKNILIRNDFQHSGIFYKWQSGKKITKILVGKKVVGANSVILSYKWYYMTNPDIVIIVDYFLNIFKMALIDWYNENESKITHRLCDDFTRDDLPLRKLYDKYYKNVMSVNDNTIVAELKQFILAKI
jgi:hypothetical protein